MSVGLLVDGDWVKAHRHDPDVVLLDVRSLSDYWSGHLPEARPFDPMTLSHYDTSASGLATLAGQYSYIFSLLGIDGSERVVVYENRSDARAARAAWLLEYLGHQAVSILDGGLGSVRDPALTTEVPRYAPKQFVARQRDALVASADEVRARLAEPGVHFVDTRRAAEYYGEEKRAKRIGAIPGAVHRDYTDNIDRHGRFKPASDLRAAYEAFGFKTGDDVIAYCGGGARAAHTYYALRLAGFAAPRNYTGSWGEWGNRDDLPVEQPARLR
ncbi:sulfurtransferase [Chitinasiproducens palmae]|uniref:Thiosulfate/3-mercaptopyruvate sulfurtransferase n=1 Tax=Chitinasiproducens palmae TaxID=1770053 RepID=A0A1H2PUE9_9BURK|nr:rhodanese-like domain-containing protein [Chitinasiproducens palmae]SDV50805.1 thiosulfate/3-mercaptopyruvate sulfurtransferase [Chitinasiproducens palmae]